MEAHERPNKEIFEETDFVRKKLSEALNNYHVSDQSHILHDG